MTILFFSVFSLLYHPYFPCRRKERALILYPPCHDFYKTQRRLTTFFRNTDDCSEQDCLIEYISIYRKLNLEHIMDLFFRFSILCVYFRLLVDRRRRRKIKLLVESLRDTQEEMNHVTQWVIIEWEKTRFSLTNESMRSVIESFFFCRNMPWFWPFKDNRVTSDTYLVDNMTLMEGISDDTILLVLFTLSLVVLWIYYAQ